jgi:hypothetical protein
VTSVLQEGYAKALAQRTSFLPRGSAKAKQAPNLRAWTNHRLLDVDFVENNEGDKTQRSRFLDSISGVGRRGRKLTVITPAEQSQALRFVLVITIIDSNATHRKHYSSPDWELNIKMRVHISRHNMLYNVDSDNLQRPRDDHARSSEADDLP